MRYVVMILFIYRSYFNQCCLYLDRTMCIVYSKSIMFLSLKESFNFVTKFLKAEKYKYAQVHYTTYSRVGQLLKDKSINFNDLI